MRAHHPLHMGARRGGRHAAWLLLLSLLCLLPLPCVLWLQCGMHVVRAVLWGAGVEGRGVQG